MDISQYLDEMRDIQTYLLNFIEKEKETEENYHYVQQFLNNQKNRNNTHELKITLYLLSKICNNHYRRPNFFPKIEKILLLLQDKIKEYYSNIEIFYIFRDNKRILLFLIKEQIIIFNDEIAKEMITGKYHEFKYHLYFTIEYRQFFQQNTKNDIIFSDIIDEISKEIPLDFEEKRNIGENDDYICQLIRNDLIDDFISYVNKNNYPLYSTIKPSIYETNKILLKKTFSNKLTLIEYAAFFGSIQIFKYLYLNGVELKQSLWFYSIHGDHPEIIQTLIDKNVVISSEECYKESIKCHHNATAEYIRSNFLSTDDKIDFLEVYLKYYNFVFIQKEKITSNSFIYICKYDYTYIVDLFLQNNAIDINLIYPPKNEDHVKFYKTPLIIAIVKKRINIIKLLLKQEKINVNLPTLVISEEDEEEQTPLIYAIKKGNIEIVHLLLQQNGIDVNYQVEKKTKKWK